MLIKIFLLLFMAGTCLAQDTVYYLVYSTRLPHGTTTFATLTSMGFQSISEAGGQPFRITDDFQPANTNYALITITPRNNTEINSINWFLSVGIMEKIGTRRVITEKDAGIGGYITRAEYEQVSGLPTDFYRVVVSTP